MAQHNLILGTAIKSVGDITLYRRDGKQVSRVRVRNVANPRTEAQAITRNFLAPVIKFYAPLADTLARSFEGLNKSRSYNEYQRVNIALARTEQWFLPKGEAFTPMPYMLSRGQLTAFTYSIADGMASFDIPKWTYPNALSVGTISQGLIRNGCKLGDVVTLIFVVKDTIGNYTPRSCQFYVNPNSDEDFVALLPDVIALYATVPSTNEKLQFTGYRHELCAFAAINARRKGRRWLRSTQRLAVAQDIIDELVSATNRAAAIESYERGGSDDDGPVYPSGDGQAFNVATRSGRALLFYGGQYNAQAVSNNGYQFIQLQPANITEYFYLYYDQRGYMGTNGAASTLVSDWRVVSGSPTDATNANTILITDSNEMRRYLSTIGYSGA